MVGYNFSKKRRTIFLYVFIASLVVFLLFSLTGCSKGLDECKAQLGECSNNISKLDERNVQLQNQLTDTVTEREAWKGATGTCQTTLGVCQINLNTTQTNLVIAQSRLNEVKTSNYWALALAVLFNIAFAFFGDWLEARNLHDKAFWLFLILLAIWVYFSILKG